MSKTYSPPSNEKLECRGIRFVPTNCYSPNHWAAKHLVFAFERFDTISEYEAMNKASLANQIATSLEHLSRLKEIEFIIPATFRLLGYKD